ncbi:MAG: DPP IV N-terminal domain-containing protein [Pirellulales bacterium]|nr:DPP IV N-terminal domain-containing protein [Pirellulales bacterium]
MTQHVARTFIFALAFFGSLSEALSQPSSRTAGDAPRTVAETSNYKATSLYADVVNFCDQLAKLSPRVVRQGVMATTIEGRDLPLLILADPPVASAAEAHRSGKPVIYAQGNIHAGEVCGKEALLMLARDVALAENHAWLKDVILVIAPIYNADGNERVDKGNRPGQQGPEEGMGQRPNAQGYDLNRDHIKLESPEARGLVKLMTEWDPAMCIDTHTTNGSHHRYTLTFDGNRHPGGDTNLVNFMRYEFLPDVSKRTRDASGYDTFFYGNFDRNHSRWDMYPSQPRYDTPYVGLRNRLGVLTEAYSYAPYKDRVLCTKEFVTQCVQTFVDDKQKILSLLQEARKATIAAGKTSGDDDDTVAIRIQSAKVPEKTVVKGYVERTGGGRRRPQRTEEHADYELDFYGISEPMLAVTRPVAYLFPASYESAVEKLQHHGVQIEVLREDRQLEVEVYRVDEVQRARRPFQGHEMVTVEATPENKQVIVPAGTIVVRTGQPLGSLCVNLLEPESEDGLTTWNFFDQGLEPGAQFPVSRLMSDVRLHTAALTQDTDDTKKPITFDLIYGPNPPNFNGSPLSTVGWSEDGNHYLQMVNGVLSKVDAETGDSEEWLNRGPLADVLAQLPSLDGETAKRLANLPRLQMTPQFDAALFTHSGNLYYARLDGTKAVQLTDNEEPAQLAQFSPDGRTVAFVRGYDLYAVAVETQTERALTSGGTDLIRNAIADWVYFEEIYGRNRQGYRWSPDSKHIAVMQFDDTDVSEFTVINNARRPPRVEVARYPKAGATNPTVKLGVVSLETGEITWADLSSYSADNMIISHYGFYPDGSTAYCYVQDRAQKWLDFLLVDPQSGAVRKLFRDENGAWVDNTLDPVFLGDSSFLWLSERTGWKHIYHYSPDGQLIRQITDGPWEVTSLAMVDQPNDFIYFNGTKDSHIASNLYRVSFDGATLQRLTPEGGTHRVSVSPKGNYFVDTYSSLTQTPKVNLRSTDGELVRVLDDNPVDTLDDYVFCETEQFQIETRDGFPLEAKWVKPVNFDPNKKYPVWFMTYGGPHAPTINDSWGRAASYDQMLAQMGILVFRCDPRSASSRGAQSTWTAYKQLGIQELEDIKDAIGWLKEHSFVDGDRIGMAGHSYGGFMTAFCMTKTDLFCAGISGAPVTDWHNYDSFYTERYMDTPQANPEGYKKTSVVDAAANLHGRLLLLHGAIDDNVHMQNSMQFIQALQRANKQFELMIYPTNRHGLRGNHYRKLTVDFIKRNLGVE